MPSIPLPDTDPLASASDLLDAAELVRLVRDEFQRDLSVAAAKVSAVASRRPWLGRAAARLWNAVADLDELEFELSDELSCPALKEQADKLRARAGEAKKEEAGEKGEADAP